MRSTKLDSIFEASLQNFCAGLIIAAVAADLFPLLKSESESIYSILGIGSGLVLAYLFVNNVDKMESCIVGDEDDKNSHASRENRVIKSKSID
jgi:hypothetical protein